MPSPSELQESQPVATKEAHNKSFINEPSQTQSIVLTKIFETDENDASASDQDNGSEKESSLMTNSFSSLWINVKRENKVDVDEKEQDVADKSNFDPNEESNYTMIINGLRPVDKASIVIIEKELNQELAKEESKMKNSSPSSINLSSSTTIPTLKTPSVRLDERSKQQGLSLPSSRSASLRSSSILSSVSSGTDSSLLSNSFLYEAGLRIRKLDERIKQEKMAIEEILKKDRDGLLTEEEKAEIELIDPDEVLAKIEYFMEKAKEAGMDIDKLRKEHKDLYKRTM